MVDKEGENEGIFFREIRQIKLGYVIHNGMIDEEEFISVLCMDGKWGFGRFCCELAEEYREPDLCKS